MGSFNPYRDRHEDLVLLTPENLKQVTLNLEMNKQEQYKLEAQKIVSLAMRQGLYKTEIPLYDFSYAKTYQMLTPLVEEMKKIGWNTVYLDQSLVNPRLLILSWKE
jgi:hypothetical protein